MSKNAYEIRLELLKMAQEMCSREMDVQNDIMYQAIDTAEPGDKVKAAEKYKPKMYTTKDVMDKANELYNFVNK